MDYKKFFSESINSLKKSGEYRIFRDIGRIAGSYPNAKFNNITKNHAEWGRWICNGNSIQNIE